MMSDLAKDCGNVVPSNMVGTGTFPTLPQKPRCPYRKVEKANFLVSPSIGIIKHREPLLTIPCLWLIIYPY